MNLQLILLLAVWQWTLGLVNCHDVPILKPNMARFDAIRHKLKSISSKKQATTSSSSSSRVTSDRQSLLQQHSHHLQHIATNVLHTGQDHIHTLISHLTATAKCIASSPSFPHYIAGITAGTLECLVGHPLDTIRVRIITAGSGGGSGNAASMLGQLRHAIVEEGGAIQGIRSLYRGVHSELLSAAVAGALLFGVNDFFKRWARGELRGSAVSLPSSAVAHPPGAPGAPHAVDSEEDERVTAPLLVAAAGTGLMDGIISKPLEMLKLRQQILPSAPSAPLAPLTAVGRLIPTGVSGGSLGGGVVGAGVGGLGGVAAEVGVLGGVAGVGVGWGGPLGHLSALGAALTQGE